MLQLRRAFGVHDEVYFQPRDAKSATQVWLPDWMRPIEAVRGLVTVPDAFLERNLISALVIPNPLRDPRWRHELQRDDVDLDYCDGLRGLGWLTLAWSGSASAWAWPTLCRRSC